MQTTATADNTIKDLLLRLGSYVKPYWLLTLVGFVATMMFSVVDSAGTYLVQPLINKGFINRDAHFIRYIPAAFVCLFIIRGAMYFFSNYCMSRVARTVVMQMRQQLFSHFQHMPARQYDHASTGTLLSKLLYDTEQVSQASTESLVTFIQSFFSVMGLLTVMFIISWRLSLMFFVTAPFVVGIVKYFGKRVRRLSGEAQKAMGLMTEIAEENIAGYREVRVYGGQRSETEKFDRAANLCRQCDLKVVMARSYSVASAQIVTSLGIAYITYLAISPNSTSILSPGGFASLIVAMITILKPLKNLTQVNNDLARGLAGARSVFTFLDTQEEIDNGAIELKNCRGDVRFANVNFSYDSESEDKKIVLKNINFHLRHGETVALVGRSGSGKSTIASLLARFYQITDGKIFLDDHDVCDITLRSLRRHIAVVSQHVTLFNGTIRQNIAYGDSANASSDDIERAARDAYVLDFAQSLPRGLDTVIGENGVLLSGGQRQRIAIARAILKNAPILILDEATSALDTQSERHIQLALEAVMRGRTTLVIAHRLSTIENADRILVLEKGELVEEGTHHNLLARESHYARLHSMQFSQNHDTHEAVV